MVQLNRQFFSSKILGHCAALTVQSSCPRGQRDRVELPLQSTSQLERSHLMTLCLHTGGEEIALADLRDLDTPAATASHVPIPHIDVVDMVRYALGFHGHDIVEEAHAITPGGDRYFGLLSLRSRARTAGRASWARRPTRKRAVV
ncbi:hypothetical protein LCL97_00460 [Seohaeicola saemankumensis]|nr:hypothetical protein [Seohaeicola saemankumensis]MCA0869284.1 hypothetical protein [Seohaeicola saemankumensis]